MCSGVLESVEHWVSMLPPQERSQPIIDVDGVWLTPIQMLEAVKAGTDIGRKAQEKFETMGLGTEKEMLIERIKKRLGRYPQDKPLLITLDGKLTPSQIISEIERGTDLGNDLIDTERRYLSYLGSLGGR